MRSWFASFVVAATAMAAGLHTASAASVTPIYSFCSAEKCADGAQPTAPLVIDSQGALYGTTTVGGAGAGVVFRLTPQPQGGYTQKVLHTFCFQSSKPTCTDGTNPYGRVVVDPDGNVYGLTVSGGFNNDGVFYRVTARGKYSVLFKFCKGKGDCKTGTNPYLGLTYFGAESGLPYDGTSPLYGVSGPDLVFRLSQSGGKWTFTTLFGAPAQISNLITSPDGSSFFMQTYGEMAGSLYKATPGSGSGQFAVNLLGNFCQQRPCNEGGNPTALTVDPDTGNLYGTTTDGSTKKDGAVWESMAPDYSSFLTIHPFCSDNHNCVDGYITGPMDMGPITATGPVYGATAAGGLEAGTTLTPYTGAGTIFEVAADGTYSTVHQFCSGVACSDGLLPLAGLTPDGHGHYFGVTQFGGSGKYGTNKGDPYSRGGLLYEFNP